MGSEAAGCSHSPCILLTHHGRFPEPHNAPWRKPLVFLWESSVQAHFPALKPWSPAGRRPRRHCVPSAAPRAAVEGPCGAARPLLGARGERGHPGVPLLAPAPAPCDRKRAKPLSIPRNVSCGKAFPAELPLCLLPAQRAAAGTFRGTFRTFPWRVTGLCASPLRVLSPATPSLFRRLFLSPFVCR